MTAEIIWGTVFSRGHETGSLTSAEVILLPLTDDQIAYLHELADEKRKSWANNPFIELPSDCEPKDSA